MEYKKAVSILTNLLSKYSLKGVEKVAVLTAIGVLDMAFLAKNSIKRRIKLLKDKRKKSIELR